jgi:hypothetical protein
MRMLDTPSMEDVNVMLLTFKIPMLTLYVAFLAQPPLAIKLLALPALDA